jgi:hypothetical protein
MNKDEADAIVAQANGLQQKLETVTTVAELDAVIDEYGRLMGFGMIVPVALIEKVTAASRLEPYVKQIYYYLADASQGTVDPDRAMDIARRAVAEACDNREGK